MWRRKPRMHTKVRVCEKERDWVCVCMRECVCERERVYVYVCVRERERVCVWIRKSAHAQTEWVVNLAENLIRITRLMDVFNFEGHCNIRLIWFLFKQRWIRIKDYGFLSIRNSLFISTTVIMKMSHNQESSVDGLNLQREINQNCDLFDEKIGR